MSSTPAQLRLGIDKILTDSNKFHAIVHGSATDPDVVTEGGNVPTVARAVAAIASSGVGDQVAYNQSAVQKYAYQMVQILSRDDPAGKFAVGGGSGDSMADGTGPVYYWMIEQSRRLGIGAVCSGSFSHGIEGDANGEFSLGGPVKGYAEPDFGGAGPTLAKNNLIYINPNYYGNFTYLANGNWYSIPVGGSTTEKPLANIHRVGWSKIRCWFAKTPGTKNAVINIYQDGVNTVINQALDCTGTGLTYIDITSANTGNGGSGLKAQGPPTIVITANGGQVEYIGSYCYMRSGFVPVCLSYGGCSLAQQYGQSPQQAANMITYLTVMDAGTIMYNMKEEDLTGTDFNNHMDRMATNFPYVSHLVILPSPSASETTNDLPLRQIMKDKAMSKGFAIFDNYLVGKNIATLTALGWTVLDGGGTDTTHLSQQFRMWSATLIDELFFASGQLITNTGKSSYAKRREVGQDKFLRRTDRSWAPFNLGSDKDSSLTMVTVEIKDYVQIYWAAAPVAGTSCGVRLMSEIGVYGRQNFKARWTMRCPGIVAGSTTLWMKFGGSVLKEAGNPTEACIAVEYGVDASGPMSGVGYVRLWNYTSAGGTGPNYSSPKFYLPAGADNYGYTFPPGSGINFSLKYYGNQGNTAKRIQLWACPPNPWGSGAKFQPKNILVADWEYTVNDGNSGSPLNYAIMQAKFLTAAATGYTGYLVTNLAVDYNDDEGPYYNI